MSSLFSGIGTLVANVTANAVQFYQTLSDVSSRLTGFIQRFSVIPIRILVNPFVQGFRGAGSLGLLGRFFLARQALRVGEEILAPFAAFQQDLIRSVGRFGLSGQTAQEQIQEGIFGISTKSVSGPVKMIEVFRKMADEGLSARDALRALGVAEQFAVANTEDLEKSTMGLLRTQKALGLFGADTNANFRNMNRVSDVLTKASTLGAGIHPLDLANSLEAAGPSLKDFNVGFEDSVAVLAAFSAAGDKGAAAGHRLIHLLDSLRKESVVGAGHAFQALGINIYDSHQKMLPLTNIVGQIGSLFAGATDHQKALIMQILRLGDGSTVTARQMASLSGAIKVYKDILDKAGGATEIMANENLKSFSAQMEILKNNVITVAIDIGNVLYPHLMAVNDVLQDFIRWWKGLNPATKEVIGNFVALGLALAAIQIVFLAIQGALFLMMGGLSAIGSILFAPLSLILIGIAGVILALQGPEGLTHAWDNVKDYAKDFFDKTIGFFYNFRENMSLIGRYIRDNWRIWLYDLGRVAGTIASNLLYDFMQALILVGNLFLGLGGELFKGLKKLPEILFPIFMKITDMVIDMVGAIVVAFGWMFGELAKPTNWARAADVIAEFSGKIKTTIQREVTSKIIAPDIGEGPIDFEKAMKKPVDQFLKDLRGPLEGFERTQDLMMPTPKGGGPVQPPLRSLMLNLGIPDIKILPDVLGKVIPKGLTDLFKGEGDLPSRIHSPMRTEQIIGDTYKEISLARFSLEGPGGLSRSGLAAAKRLEVHDRELTLKVGELNETVKRMQYVTGE